MSNNNTATSNTHANKSSQENTTSNSQPRSSSSEPLADKQSNKKASSSNAAKGNAAQQQVEAATQEITYKPVDVLIGGKSYTINCPADEVAELKKASNFIHNYVQDMRRQAPTLSHENLLVLCCLNLYESIQQAEKAEAQHKDIEAKSSLLIDKILTDTQSILSS